MDLELLGSSHPVPMDLGSRRWQSMAFRELNSPSQWAHLNPNAIGAFLLPPARSAGRNCRLRDRYQLLVCRYDTEVTHTFRQRIDEKRTQQTKMQIYALFCTSHGMCPGRIGILRENKTLSKSDSKFHEKGQINKGTCVNSNKK